MCSNVPFSVCSPELIASLTSSSSKNAADARVRPTQRRAFQGAGLNAGLEEAQSRSFTDASTASKKQLPGVYVKAGCDCIPIFAMNSWNAPCGVGFAFFFFAAEEEAEEEQEDADAEDSSAEEGETDERDVDTEDSSAEEEEMDEEDDDDADDDDDDDDNGDDKERFSDPVVIAAAVEDGADAAAL